MAISLKPYFTLIKDAALDWLDDEAPRLAAALSYYTAFAIAPLLVLTIAIVGLVIGRDKASAQIVEQFDHLIGRQGAEMMATVIENSSKSGSGVIATVVGIVALLFGATGVFGELKAALNKIWEVELKPAKGRGGIWRIIRTRLLSFAMVLCIAFLLLTSLVVSAVLAGVGTWVGGVVGGELILLRVTSFLVTMGVLVVLFALMFKILPDAEIGWREVWVGAIVTGILFAIGKFLIGLYLGRSGVASVYGAAGSLAIVLLWVYYSALIFLFGAEVTQANAKRLGKEIRPAPGAVKRVPGKAESRKQARGRRRTGGASGDGRAGEPSTPRGLGLGLPPVLGGAPVFAAAEPHARFPRGAARPETADGAGRTDAPRKPSVASRAATAVTRAKDRVSAKAHPVSEFITKSPNRFWLFTGLLVGGSLLVPRERTGARRW